MGVSSLKICYYYYYYPLRAHLQGLFRGAALTQDQKNYNTAMNGARTAVEWVCGDIINYFKFLDFKKNLKIGLSAVGKMYVDCALIQNAHTILYQSDLLAQSTLVSIHHPLMVILFNQIV